MFESISNKKYPNSHNIKEILKNFQKKQTTRCPYCSSIYILKNGNALVREEKCQRYICKNCKKNFRESTGTILEKTRITTTDLEKLFVYFQKGLSSREIANKNINVSHVTVTKWRHKLKKLLLTTDIDKL